MGGMERREKQPVVDGADGDHQHHLSHRNIRLPAQCIPPGPADIAGAVLRPGGAAPHGGLPDMDVAL